MHDDFARAWFASADCQNLLWHGIPIQKNPLDLFLYQELLHTIRPDFIIETGAARGGSTLFFAHMLDLLGHGSVISVDVEDGWLPVVRAHPRVFALLGDSAAAETVGWVRHIVGNASTFVILDSNHQQDHVLAELRAYAPFVHPGHFLVAEDTIINHPTPAAASSPWEAVDQFLAESPDWRLTPNCSRLHFSFANHGYLQRVT